MNAWSLPDGRVLAAEHAYRRDTLLAATRPLPDVVGLAGRLVGAVRRTLAAARPTTPVTPRPSARDLPLGHSAVCR